MPMPGEAVRGKVTLIVRAEDLPEVVLVALGTPPAPVPGYVVTAELKEESDEDRLATLRADVAAWTPDSGRRRRNC